MLYKNNFEELNIQVIDGDRGKNYPHNDELFPQGDVLFLSNKNIINNKLSLNEAQFITIDKHNQMGKGSLLFNDIVITTRGTLGNVLYINHNFRLPARINSGMVIIKPTDNYIPRFLYYYFISPKFNSFIQESKSGAAQPQLPIKDLVKIKLPNLSNILAQQHIVDSI